MIGALALIAAWITAITLIRTTGVFDAVAQMGRATQRSLRIIRRSRVSEWAKERAIQLVSLRIIGTSLGVLMRVLLIASPFVLVFALDAWRPFGVRAAFVDWRLRLVLLGAAVVIILVMRRRRSASGSADTMMMRVGLSKPALEIAFDIERQMFAAKAGEPTERPVFVAGLARAGTTIITRTLLGLGDYATNRYRDLPFPLAPNLWAQLSKGMNRKVVATERGHGDGLMHDLDSPEAIEEVFWLLKEGARYRRADGLHAVQPEPETLRDFRTYVACTMLRDRKSGYLSKNNNNILRLEGLVEAFPQAVLVHPFREPVQQAASLRNQHLRACALAADDPGRGKFMSSLGHHEFGADHRPFVLGDDGVAGDPATLDYWVRRWIATYRFLLDQSAPVAARQIFVDYDDLAAGRLDAIYRIAGADVSSAPPEAMRPPRAHGVDAVDPHLAREAADLHARLVARAAA